MSSLVIAALMLGTPIVHEHQTELDHRGHKVAVTYRASHDIDHRQVGSVAPAGRAVAGGLRCHWTAKTVATREAVSAAGHVVSRTMVHDSALTGSRAGWCDGHREAIAAEVTKRAGPAARAHLAELAARDRATLVADLDAAHTAAGG